MKTLLLTCTSISLMFLVACSQNQSADGEQKAEPVAETATNSANQNEAPIFAAPDGWEKTANDNYITFVAPEGDATLTLVNLNNAKGAVDAALQAFIKVNPGFDRTVKLNNPDTPARGWAAISEIEYQTSPAENRLVYAYVHQYNDEWTVMLLDGHMGTIAKRGAAARTMLGSITRPGFIAEDLSTQTAQLITPKKLADMLNFVKTSADALSVPGVGIGIIQNGKVVFSGGVGVKSIENGEAIDGNTRFMIASNTKGMTTLLLAKLVEMGRVKWDDPVIKHYPSFRLGDDETTKSVLIKHLVCACTGLPRKDFEWVFNNGPDTPATNTFAELAATQPTSGFGELYQYNNQMASAAGYVAAHLFYPDMEIGAAYDLAMQTYVFDPLEMANTTFDFDLAIGGNVAAPHAIDFDGNVTLIEQNAETGFNHTATSLRPAGAAWSTTSDMLNYIQNELSAGLGHNNTRIFAEGPLLERRNETVSTGANSSYGMGLSTRNISGIEIVEHGGSMGGYKSQMVIIPDANIGAVILTNSDEGQSLLRPFGRKLIELVYNGQPKAAEAVDASVQSTKAYLSSERAKLTIPADPQISAQLAKQYTNPALGIVDIRSDGSQLIFDSGIWSSTVGTKTNEDNTQSLVLIEGIARDISLLIGKENGKRTLSLIYGQDFYTFTEVD